MSEPRKLFDRAARQGLLDGGDPEMCHRVQDLAGAVEAPGAVGVEPKRRVGPERFAHGCHPGDVVVEPDLHLDVAEADRPHLSCVLHGPRDRAGRDDAAVGHAIPPGRQQRSERTHGPSQRAIEHRELERGTARVWRDRAGKMGLGQEGGECLQIVGRRHLAVGDPRPQLFRKMVEHGLDRLAGDVGAGRSLTVPLRPDIVAHPHHHRIGPAPFAGAMTERLHERDPQRVQRGRHQLHRRAPPAPAATKSRK